MHVRLKTMLCGPDGNHGPGTVIDLPPESAKHLIATGQAEGVPAGRETAARRQPERAAVTDRGETRDAGATASEEPPQGNQQARRRKAKTGGRTGKAPCCSSMKFIA